MIRKIKVSGNIAIPLPDRLEGTHQLDLTEDQYNRFTGSRFFVVENGEPRPITAQEEADMDAEEAKATALSDLKSQRDADLMSVVVTINGNDIWANPTEEQNILGRIRQMETAGLTSCKWIQGEAVFNVTKTELEQVLAEGTAQCSDIYDAYITAVEAL